MFATDFPQPLSCRHNPAKGAAFLFLIGLLLSSFGCAALTETRQVGPDPSPAPSRSGDELLVVDCLLPGQVKKLGRSMVYLTPRRPIKTSAQDCEIRGGEYVAYDRGDYATALKVWLPPATEGDKVSQTYVGEIYEKGLGVQPDYPLAVEWYRKAAEQGYARAQINLGYLYEKGLGVEKDPGTALNWYRRAAGLSDGISIDPASTDSTVRNELEGLRQEVERQKRESDSLRAQLAQTQQQLDQTQRELDRRKGEAEAERQRLEKDRHELEARQKQAATASDRAETTRLAERLKQREADLERQQREINRLRQAMTQLEVVAAGHRKQLEEQKKQQVALAGPTIEVIDPPLVARGDTPRVKARSGVDRVIIGKVAASAGLLTFTINDRQEQPDGNGLFKVLIPVERSNLPVTMVAVDKQGKRATIEFLLTPEDAPVEVASLPTSPPLVKKKPAMPTLDLGGYYALIIGNHNYTYWPRLDTPANDATKTAELLSRKYGFKTKTLLNASRYDILRALNEVHKELTEKDNLLIYYAGHGYLDDRIGRGYWIPIDGEMDSNANWISTFAITDILNTIPARHVLVVADTCYAGALTRSALARLEAGMSDEARYNWLKIIAEKRSRTVLTSGDLKPVLDSVGGGHSVFARAFLDVLKENDEILEGQRVYQEVSARVAYAASAVMTDRGPIEQVPQYAPIKFAGHESGDFLFVPTAN